MHDLGFHTRQGNWTGAMKAAFNKSISSRFKTMKDLEDQIEEVRIQLPFECHNVPQQYDFNVDLESGLFCIWATFEVIQGDQFDADKRLSWGQRRAGQREQAQRDSERRDAAIRQAAIESALRQARQERDAQAEALRQEAAAAVQLAREEALRAREEA